MLQPDIILNEFTIETHRRRGVAGRILYDGQRPPPPNVGRININCAFTYSWLNNLTAALQFIDAVLCDVDTLSVSNSRGEEVVFEFVAGDTCEELYIAVFTENSQAGHFKVLFDINRPDLPNRTLDILYAGKQLMQS